MRTPALLLLLIIITACNGSPKVDPSTTSGNINASAPYLWHDKAFPKTVRVSNSYTAAEVTALQLMSTAWKTSVEDQVTFFNYGAVTPEVTNTLNSMDDLLDSILGIYKTTNWPLSLPGSALAVTQIFGRRYNTGSSSEFVNIEHADILVNFDLYDFDTADAGPGFDFRTVVLHEMGHFLGLQHKSVSSSRASSVMYPSIDSNESKRAPLTIDISDMVSKYGITLPSGGSHMTAAALPTFTIKPGDTGAAVKIQIELHADGTCVHRENGAVILRHPSGIKN